MATEATRDKLIAGVAAWVANPLPQVGAKSTGLSVAPHGQDIYSATGCRGGSLTSWAQGSVSSLASLQLYAGDGPARVNLANDVLRGDQPTAAELELAQPNQRALFRSGKLRFFRGVGFLTHKQMMNDRYQRRIAATLAPSGDTPAAKAVVAETPSTSGGSKAPPKASPPAGPPAATAVGIDNTNWNTYSDTVPVYSVGVNSWANEDEVVPFSSLYNHVAERITDPNATGALGALVKGSTMKDSASVITMVKHMQRGNGSYKDEAPLVRAYNMLTATTLAPNGINY